jgi:hypothetical protein
VCTNENSMAYCDVVPLHWNFRAHYFRIFRDSVPLCSFLPVRDSRYLAGKSQNSLVTGI